jgi:uncharacterized protein (UPF0303 family)
MPGAEPDFDEFNHDTAWELGCALVGHRRAHTYAVTISIHIGQQRVFHAALPGSSADNDDWVMRKTRVVQRFDRASQEVGRTTVGDTGAFHPACALPASDYAPTGGAVPIRIHGTTIGVLAISGLSSDRITTSPAPRCVQKSAAKTQARPDLNTRPTSSPLSRSRTRPRHAESACRRRECADHQVIAHRIGAVRPAVRGRAESCRRRTSASRRWPL